MALKNEPWEIDGEKSFSSCIPSKWKVLYNVEGSLEQENHSFVQVHNPRLSGKLKRKR